MQSLSIHNMQNINGEMRNEQVRLCIDWKRRNSKVKMAQKLTCNLRMARILQLTFSVFLQWHGGRRKNGMHSLASNIRHCTMYKSIDSWWAFKRLHSHAHHHSSFLLRLKWHSIYVLWIGCVPFFYFLIMCGFPFFSALQRNAKSDWCKRQKMDTKQNAHNAFKILYVKQFTFHVKGCRIHLK